MTIDVAVVGQGIAGILLARELQRAGKRVCVIDNADPCSASWHAGAILNPVNLGNMTPAMTAEQLDTAKEAYQDLSRLLGSQVCSALGLFAYVDKELPVSEITEAGLLPAEPPAKTAILPFFVPPERCSLYSLKVARIHYALLRRDWLTHLENTAVLLRDTFDHSALRWRTGGYAYKHLRFPQIVFCEGLRVRQNPFFQHLNFTKNRGDYLLLQIPGLPADYVYHYGLRLVPEATGHFWYGSNYQWQYSNLHPDEVWKAKALDRLKHWLKLPFRVLHHGVAERPTRAGQLPVLEQHPDQPGMYCFNGLGTKGFALGPYLARHMAGLMRAEAGSATRNRSR